MEVRMSDGKGKRARRKFTDEYKASAVRLVLEEEQGIAKVAKDLDLTESALRMWVSAGEGGRRGWQVGVRDDDGEGGARSAAEGEPRAAHGA